MTTTTATNAYCNNTITTDCWPGTVSTNTWVSVPNYVEKSEYQELVEEIVKRLEKLEKKESKKMNVINFPKFGPITDDSIRYSPKGAAVKNKDGEYVIYNPKTTGIENVGVFAMKGNFFYLMPAAMKDVTLEDIILHQGNYCFVLDGDETSLTVIDLITNEQRVIYPSVSPFGFTYISKVVSPLAAEPASKDSPFGDMALMMMMQDGNNKDMLPLLLMSKSSDMKDMLPYLMMCNNGK